MIRYLLFLLVFVSPLRADDIVQNAFAEKIAYDSALMLSHYLKGASNMLKETHERELLVSASYLLRIDSKFDLSDERRSSVRYMLDMIALAHVEGFINNPKWRDETCGGPLPDAAKLFGKETLPVGKLLEDRVGKLTADKKVRYHERILMFMGKQ